MTRHVCRTDTFSRFLKYFGSNKASISAGIISALAGLSATSAIAAVDLGVNLAVEKKGEAPQIEEIIVTARRRVETIQTTPISVSVVTGADIDKLGGPATIQDLAALTPNITISPIGAAPGAAQIGIRGVSFDDLEKSFDPAVGVLIDGVYMGTNTGQLVHAFDFASVEVLRGPQGTLFGRNTPGGVINIRRTAPTGDWGVDVNAGGGNYGGLNFSAVVNLPKVMNSVSAKLYYDQSQTGGYYYNVTLQDNEPKERYRNYGATLLLNPSEGLDYRLTLERVENDGTAEQATQSGSNTDLICIEPFPFGAPVSECNRNDKQDLYTTFSSGPNAYQYGNTAVSGEGNWRIGGVTLTLVTGYQNETEFLNDGIDASSILFYKSARPQGYHQFSQELRAAGNITPNLDFVAGLYHFNSAYHLDQGTTLGPGLSFPLPELQTVQNTSQTSESNAVFADFNWKFLPRWRLTVGGRETWDRKTTQTQITDNPDVCFPSLTCLQVPKIGHGWNAFTPKASVDWQATDQIMGYASYSVGYRSGGFNGRPTTAASASQPYNPEKVQSFEVGAKTEWLENRLVINGDVFLTKYKDKQEQVVESSTIAPYDETVVANAASATIKGVELEFKALPSKGLILHGSLGLLDAAYDHFYALTCTTPDPANTAPATPDNPQPKCPLVQADLKSLTMKETPHTSFSLGFDYSMPSPLGLWTLSSNYSYISSYQTTIVAAVGNPFDNDPRALRQPEKTLNSALRWSHEYGQSEAQISVWGRNLLNDRGLGDGVLPVGGGGYSAAGLPAVDLWTFGYARSPRMFGVNVGYKYR